MILTLELWHPMWQNCGTTLKDHLPQEFIYFVSLFVYSATKF